MQLTWKIWVATALLGAAALPALAAQKTDATDLNAGAAINKQWRTDTITTLAMRDDADSLYTAALFELSPVFADDDTMHVGKQAKQRALDLLDQAAALEPSAADVAAQALMTCSQLAGCDISSYAERYSAAAPNDALALLPALKVAVTQEDQAEITLIVQRMGTAGSFRSYLVAAGERAERGLANAPSLPDFGELARVSGGDQQLVADATRMGRSVSARMLAATVTMPAYDFLGKACMPTDAAFADRRSACRDIGMLLEHGGSAMDNRIGLLLHRRAASSDADYANAVATGRRLDWQSDLYYKKLANMRADSVPGAEPTASDLRKIIAFTRRHVKAIRQHHGEAAGIEALLAEAELPLNPPADWVDKQQQFRLAGDARVLKANASQSCKN